jgi:small subunit ribosomal protein S20
MPQHKGAVRRVRLTEKRRVANKGQKIELRKLMKAFEPSSATAPTEVSALQSQLDKLAKKGLVHKNFAANKKSKLARSISEPKV